MGLRRWSREVQVMRWRVTHWSYAATFDDPLRPQRLAGHRLTQAKGTAMSHTRVHKSIGINKHMQSFEWPW